MMQVAKATPEDVREAFNVNNILELLDSNTMPEDWIDENNGDDYFDKDSDSQCGMVMRNLLELVNPSALFRVAMGMSVLIDPVNKILNQDSDVLEYHPDIVSAASRITQLEAEKEQLKDKLASTKEALDFAESARADWSKRYIWLMTEVCDALGIDKDNTPAVDMVLCVRNLMQRDTRSLKLINVELLAALKTILGINFYGNTVRDGIALTDGGDHFLRNVDASIAKAEETGG